ncbi:hypothetical protein D3C73_1114440 [compost metagenome]
MEGHDFDRPMGGGRAPVRPIGHQFLEPKQHPVDRRRLSRAQTSLLVLLRQCQQRFDVGDTNLRLALRRRPLVCQARNAGLGFCQPQRFTRRERYQGRPQAGQPGDKRMSVRSLRLPCRH